MHFKDEILDGLAQKGNVAQFISYGPNCGTDQRFLWINDVVPNTKFLSAQEAIGLLIKRSSENRVNVRSFNPEQPKGHPFVYGLTKTEDVLATIKKNASEGLYSIVNETIDVNDGGVSGVALGNVIEFTPNDTPKGVDKPGTCNLPREIGLAILESVYNFRPQIDFPKNIRVEFSIHPMRRGIRMDNTIIWELEEFSNLPTSNDVDIRWPNNFSKIIGDKAFGLLVADNLGLPVPRTTVISRTVAPFTFGSDTGVSEVWIRTAPVIRTPGKFSTYKGWRDPFKILSEEDPEHNKIASVLCQQSVNSVYSGSLLTDKNDLPLIEGVAGRGDLFMVGGASIEQVPIAIINKITEVFNWAFEKLGPIEMEWVFDGEKVWTVQLHKSTHVVSYGAVIVPGTPKSYIDFDVTNGLEKLRELITTVQGTDVGIKVHGNVGVTSHYGDVLRKANIPSFVERKL